MAIDVCSTCEAFISPRISFSYDLNNQSSSSIATTSSTTMSAASTTTTFDFGITSNIVQQLTSADELFFDGILLPTQLKNPENLHPKPTTTTLENKVTSVQKKRIKEFLSDTGDDYEGQEKSSSRSFWKFKRTTSLNSDSDRGSKKLFRSLSLKRLLQSNLTDSTLNPKGNVAPKAIEKLNSPKESVTLERCSSSDQTRSLQYRHNENNFPRRSVVKKNSVGNGNRINPILNIPSPYNMNLFGFGSIFCNGKPKNRTK